MLQALGQLLPIAVAAAISTVPITAMTMILLTPGRAASAAAFAAGWSLGIAAVVCVCTLGASTLPTSRFGLHDTALGIAEILVGCGLIAAGVASWRRTRRMSARALPKWLTSIGSLGPWSSCGVGLALNIRPKGLLLGIAAGLALRGASLTVLQSAALIAIFTIVAASTVAIPVIMTLASRARMEPWLLRTREWLTTHAAVVSTVILLMIGVVAIGNGMTRL